MPQMYRAGGKSVFFKSFEAGEKAGFLRSYNDVAKAQRALLQGSASAAAPKPVFDEVPPAPPAEEPAATARPKPPADDPVAPKMPLSDLSLVQVKAEAERLGLDTTVHHMTLRKQVEESLNVEAGSD
jgi:hypothetical protein